MPLELSDPTRHTRVSEVAPRWGFINDASFSRAFRQAFGITPKEARDRQMAFLAPDEPAHDDGAASERAFANWMRTLHANNPRVSR